jgi:methionyl-tRNA formyltransferase
MLFLREKPLISKLRIAYFGDGPWSHGALQQLADRPDDFVILFVAPRYDLQDPALCNLAKDLGLEVRLFENVNDPNSIKFIKSLNLDVIVSMSFNQIFKAPFLDVPRLGTVNCHAGALPRYRGRNILNWALINGESEIGVTAHFVDQGIDTGDILHQEIIPIPEGAKYLELLELAYNACPRVLVAGLDKLRLNSAKPQPQKVMGKGFYCGRRGFGDEWIDWSWPAERVVNFVRAISAPGPGAITALGFQKVIIQDASCDREMPAYISTEGEVVGRDEAGIWIKALDSAVYVTLCQTEPHQAPFIPQWCIGTRFSGKAEYRIAQLESHIERLGVNNIT